MRLVPKENEKRSVFLFEDLIDPHSLDDDLDFRGHLCVRRVLITKDNAKMSTVTSLTYHCLLCSTRG